MPAAMSQTHRFIRLTGSAQERIPFRDRCLAATISTAAPALWRRAIVRIDFYGLAFETHHVTFHLWSPWRAAEIEHRLFTAVRSLAHTQAEAAADEWLVHLSD